MLVPVAAFGKLGEIDRENINVHSEYENLRFFLRAYVRSDVSGKNTGKP